MPPRLRQLIVDTVAHSPLVRLDYVEIVDAATLEPVEQITADTLVALAAFVGKARLIDNVTITFRGDTPCPDLGVLTASSGMQEEPLMQRIMMKSKIHRATITGADLNYVGSITLDTRLMELADIREHEQVHVLDIDNGARFETYVIRGGPGDVILNGAAARLVHPGDKVIVITYAQYDEAELAELRADRRPRRRAQPADDALGPRGRAVTRRTPRRVATSHARTFLTDLLVLGSGVAGLSAAVRARHAGLVGRRCSPRVSSGGRPPGTRKVASRRPSIRRTTRPSCTVPTRSPPVVASATPTRCACSPARVPTRVRELMALGAHFDHVDGDGASGPGA